MCAPNEKSNAKSSIQIMLIQRVILANTFTQSTQHVHWKYYDTSSAWDGPMPKLEGLTSGCTPSCGMGQPPCGIICGADAGDASPAQGPHSCGDEFRRSYDL